MKVFFHPSSTLRENLKPGRTSHGKSSTSVNQLPSDWIIYEEMSRTGTLCHVKNATLVNPITVALFSGPARLPMDVISEAECKNLMDFQIPFQWYTGFL